MIYLLKGLLIGIEFGIPVGAVGTLTLSRSLNYNAASGFITGIGSTSADILYAFIGVFGLTFISDFLIKYQDIISIIGGTFIIFLAIRTLKNKQILKEDEVKKNYLQMFLTSFMIAITNPATILTFIFAFTTFDVLGGLNFYDGFLLVLGIFFGTVIWWSVLTLFGRLLKRKMTKQKMAKINKIFAFILLAFGFLIMIKAFF